MACLFQCDLKENGIQGMKLLDDVLEFERQINDKLDKSYNRRK